MEKNETIEQILKSDIAARFDITPQEAARIAGASRNGADFMRIWESETFWKEGNSNE